MRDSMHLLEVLERRGYEPQDDARAGEGWFDRRCGSITVRVIVSLTENEATIILFDPHMTPQWRARFDGGTPTPVIVAALNAAELAAADLIRLPNRRLPDRARLPKDHR